MIERLSLLLMYPVGSEGLKTISFNSSVFKPKYRLKFSLGVIIPYYTLTQDQDTEKDKL